LQSPGARRASALGRFLRGCSESSAFARCAAGALGLAAFYRVSANAPVREEPPKRSCAPDAAHSPLAMRAPGDCNPRPRHHDLQLRSRPVASEACAPRVGRSQGSNLVVLATPIESRGSSPTVTSERGLAESGGTPACGGFSLRPNGARRGGSQYGPPRCTSAQPFLQTSRPVGFRRAAAENCRPAIFEARAT